MAIGTREQFGKAMSDMARAAAEDQSWQPSLKFLRYLESAWGPTFDETKQRDAIAVPCDTASTHRPDRAGP